MGKEYPNGFPVVTGEDIKRLNALFQPYVFYRTGRNGDRSCTCTHCGERYIIESLPRLMTPEWQSFMGARHNGAVNCPKCGVRAILKNIGIAKSRKNLVEWCKAILFHTDGETVWAEAAYVRKDYRDGLCPDLEVMPKMCYRFTPGKAQQWKIQHDWTGLGLSPGGKVLDESWIETRSIYEPFPDGYGYWAYMAGGYHAVGLDRLKDSFLRYCGYEQFEREGHKVWMDGYIHTALMRYLGAATRRPQLEMMVKMGLREAVLDLVIRKRSGKGIDWTQTDPRKGFGLDKAELKEFQAVEGRLELLRLYKSLRTAGKECTFRQLEDLRLRVGSAELGKLIRWCIRLDLNVGQAVNYLKKQDADWQRRGAIAVWEEWRDYLEAAEFLRYDLTVHNVQRPKSLKDAHDRATEARGILEAKQANKEARGLVKRLMQKYRFEYAGYLIRPPYSVSEIVEEGKALRHCVGGYAARHAQGKLTILFLRDKRHPMRPLVTIEMHGNHLQQIHGYRNERESCPENPEREDPKVRYAAILDPWLSWVKNGSKRDKDGAPILPAGAAAPADQIA